MTPRPSRDRGRVPRGPTGATASRPRRRRRWATANSRGWWRRWARAWSLCGTGRCSRSAGWGRSVAPSSLLSPRGPRPDPRRAHGADASPQGRPGEGGGGQSHPVRRPRAPLCGPDARGVARRPPASLGGGAGRSLPMGSVTEPSRASFKRASARVGLDPERLAGHSLRAGFATTAARKGKTLDAIMRQTGHRSERVARSYIRPGGAFDGNAAVGLIGRRPPRGPMAKIDRICSVTPGRP